MKIYRPIDPAHRIPLPRGIILPPEGREMNPDDPFTLALLADGSIEEVPASAPSSAAMPRPAAIVAQSQEN